MRRADKFDAYVMLFHYFALTRTGRAAEAELEADVKRLGSQEWPYPVAEYFLSKRSARGVLELAQIAEHRCEAYSYSGEWQAVRRQVTNSRKALKEARSICPKNFVE